MLTNAGRGSHYRRVRAGGTDGVYFGIGEDFPSGCCRATTCTPPIAGISTALRERALEAVARSYQQTVRELGHTEADAQIWISAVMLRLRSGVAEQRKKLELVGRRSKTSIKYANTAGPDT